MNETELLPVQLADGILMYIEATRSIREKDVSGFTNYNLEDLTRTIELFGTQIRKSIETVAPHKASIEFGLEVTAKEGQLLALLAKGSGKANLNIKLEWTHERDQA